MNFAKDAVSAVSQSTGEKTDELCVCACMYVCALGFITLFYLLQSMKDTNSLTF